MARMKFTSKPLKRLRMDLDEAAGSGNDDFNFDSDESDAAEAATAAGRSIVQDANRALLPSLGKHKRTARDVDGWELQRQMKKPRLTPRRIKPWGSWLGKMGSSPRYAPPLEPVSRLVAATKVEVGSSLARHSASTHVAQLHASTARRKPCTNAEKPKVIVMRGDPTDWSTDAIVNDANSLLYHKSGLAATIVRKGGVEIQHQSNAWIYYHEEVRVGSAMWTTAGKLSSRFIIHAVGPDVSRHRWPTQQHQLDLRRAVRSALAVADALGVTSITMPAISTGPARYPKYLAAREIVAECLQYCEDCPATSLRLIVLMNEDDVTTSFFTQALKEERQQRHLQRQSSNFVLEPDADTTSCRALPQ